MRAEEKAEKKDAVRKRILAARKELYHPETGEPLPQAAAWDQAVAERIAALTASLSPKTAVYCYAAVRGETGTGQMIRDFLERGLQVALPRVEKKEISFYYIRDPEDLEPGCMGIPEPKGSCPLAREPKAWVIVPGVAFDREFSRLGYGGGFYDRFFAREREHRKIAVCYSFQLVEKLESQSFDIPVDYLVTPDRVLVREEGAVC